MGTFGWEDVGALDSAISSFSWEIIYGSVFTIAANGKATRISVALKRGAAGSDKVKCAIYKHSDLSRVGVTDQVTTSLTTSYAWYDFPFSGTKPSLVNGTAYVLVVWADYTSKIIFLARYSGDVNQAHYQGDQTYNGFPDPLNPTHGDIKASIHCDYTEPVNYTQAISEILGLTDSVLKPLGAKKTVSDILGMLDTVKAPGRVELGIADILGLKDSTSTKAAFKRTMSDILGLKDVVSRKAAFKVTATEKLALTDSVSSKGAFKQSVSDKLGLLDSAARSRGFPTTISDILGLRDRLGAKKHKGKIGDLQDHRKMGGARSEAGYSEASEDLPDDSIKGGAG